MSLKNAIRKARRATHLSGSDWLQLFRAAFELLLARRRLSMVTPEGILRDLQNQSPPLRPGEYSRLRTVDVERISWAITLAARYVPWRSDCLIQVMAADRWLRTHNVRGDFHLGVAKDPQGALQAHAWLRYGGLTVTGGRYDDFVPLIEPLGKDPTT